MSQLIRGSYFLMAGRAAVAESIMSCNGQNINILPTGADTGVAPVHSKCGSARLNLTNPLANTCRNLLNIEGKMEAMHSMTSHMTIIYLKRKKKSKKKKEKI